MAPQSTLLDRGSSRKSWAPGLPLAALNHFPRRPINQVGKRCRIQILSHLVVAVGSIAALVLAGGAPFLAGGR